MMCLVNSPHYSKVVTLHCVEGWDATILWEGVLVRDIIRDAGADQKANTVVFTAADGYTTSFPLTYFTDRDVIMAYRMNNVTLSPLTRLPIPAGGRGQMGLQVDQVDRENRTHGRSLLPGLLGRTRIFEFRGYKPEFHPGLIRVPS